jgi:hypothetical protein
MRENALAELTLREAALQTKQFCLKPLVAWRWRAATGGSLYVDSKA